MDCVLLPLFWGPSFDSDPGHPQTLGPRAAIHPPFDWMTEHEVYRKGAQGRANGTTLKPGKQAFHTATLEKKNWVLGD